MTIHADTLIDRIRLKSQLTRWRVAAIAITVLALVALFEKDSQFAPIRGNYIARITVDGIISDDREFSEMLHEVRDDTYAKAAIIWMDTPGGSGVGGQQLYYDIRDIGRQKPVVIVMRSLTASAGYMGAVAGDRIFAREGTITGSIGVILESVEISEMAKKLGVEPIVIKTGPNKAAPSLVEPLTADQRAVLQGAINDFFVWFKDVVAERRKLPRDVVDRLADGRIYSGKQALDNKLIDQIGGEDEALDWLEQAKHVNISLDIRDVKVKRKKSDGLFEGLARGVISSILGGDASKTGGLRSIWTPAGPNAL